MGCDLLLFGATGDQTACVLPFALSLSRFLAGRLPAPEAAARFPALARGAHQNRPPLCEQVWFQDLSHSAESVLAQASDLALFDGLRRHGGVNREALLR